MKIVVFGPQRRVGALVGETVVDLNAALARSGSQANADTRLPAQLEAFIGAGQAALDEAQRAIEYAANIGPDGAVVFRAGEVKIHAPWPGKRIACAGGNFAAHLAGMEGANVTLDEITRKTRDKGQWGFWKVNDVMAGPDDVVPYPKRATYLDYEGEAAIILGKRGKDIPSGKIDEYVWGVTLLNDWSTRNDPEIPHPKNYNMAKNFDMSTSLGPCIVVGELHAGDVDVQTIVNGVVRQAYNTEEMIFSFGEILEFLSQDFTFVPGDIISGGTNSGTAQDQSKPGPDGVRPKDLFLKVGDVVEVSNPKIGTLRNRIVEA
jgi:2-keto-4-pentenoate hydratase/2-oxohepta-3-ene-1,7-dioic acid hydratase in catechol pathway